MKLVMDGESEDLPVEIEMKNVNNFKYTPVFHKISFLND